MNKISNYIKGWVIGDFEPTLLKTKDLEVGIKYYNSGTIESAHYHKISTEFTFILSGSVEMLNQTYHKGDIVKIEPNVINQFKSLTDSILMVIKIPSSKDDKYEV